LRTESVRKKITRRDGIQFIDEFISCREIWKEALSEGMKMEHPIYDMMYLISARRNIGSILTNDKKLFELAKGMRIEAKMD